MSVQSFCFSFIYSGNSSLIHNTDSEQDLLQTTPQRMRSLAAVNGHLFTEANGFTPLSIS